MDSLRPDTAGASEKRTIDAHVDRGPDARAAIRRLSELIHGIQVAMLTTVNPDGHLRSRPMSTQQSELDDELWFYFDARSALTDDITDHHQVNLVYVDVAKGRYVSVSGVAHVVRDPALLRRFWTPRLVEWFPNGPEADPHLALLRIQLEEAEYWDEDARRMVSLRGLAESDERPAVSRKSPRAGLPHEFPTREAS